MYRFLLVLLLFVPLACAQTGPLHIDFNSPQWKTIGHADVSEFEGKSVTRILGGTAIAYLDGFDFSNGTVECDMYSPTDRAFIGLAFHIQGFKDFEWIYFLPHNSETWDAVQYEPLCNQAATWQLYHGDGFQANVKIPTREWFHVRLDVLNDSAYVYLNNSKQPVLSLGLRHKHRNGLIGVCSYHPGTYANLVITPKEPSARSVSLEQYAPNPDYINTWQVSKSFQGLVDDITSIPELTDAGSWQLVSSDERGIVNLNRIYPRTPTNNTILAKVNICSDKEQTKVLNFGFSEKARIYLDGQQIYSGHNTYIDSQNWNDRGYVYDEYTSLELPLKEGDNELVLQLYEEKFGWGYVMALDNYKGLTITPAQINK